MPGICEICGDYVKGSIWRHVRASLNHTGPYITREHDELPRYADPGYDDTNSQDYDEHWGNRPTSPEGEGSGFCDINGSEELNEGREDVLFEHAGCPASNLLTSGLPNENGRR